MSSNGEQGTRVVKTVCDACMCQCGVLAHVQDGRVVKLEGDPDHPLNRGFMCPKGLSFLQTLYHPDRIIHPMKRVGGRGEGQWEQISWEQALAEIAERTLKVRDQYGGEAILYSFGTYPGKNGIPGFVGMLGALDSPGTFVPNCHYCYTPHIIGNTVTAGAVYACEFGCPDFQDSRLVVLWGWNPPASYPAYGKNIVEAHKNGAKLVVVDPRFTELAAKADLWLQPRPGTDGALALAFINVIIEEELYDKAFVADWCVGFDELRERAREYPPAKVAEITWVPEDKIIAAARLYATTSPAHMHTHQGTSYGSNVFQTSRAIAMLPALTGNMDIPGGNIFSNGNYPPVLTYMNIRQLLRPSTAAEDRQLGIEKFPFLAGSKSLRGYSHPPSVFKAMLTGEPYPIKAFFASTNSIVTFESSRNVAKALDQLDLLVSLDFFLTPTAEMADYLLPPATWLEREDVVDSFGYYGYVAARPRTIEPVGECRDDEDIAFALLDAMGLEYPVPGLRSNRDLLDFQLKETGLDFEQFAAQGLLYGQVKSHKYETTGLRTDGRVGFNTPSGKVEFYAARLEALGEDPLPYHREPYESAVSSPDLAEEYPLILIGGSRHIASFNSAGHNIPHLRELLPDPLADIHPETAAALGIADGDWIWIETPRGEGRVKQRARLTLGIHPQVVHAQSLWWYPEETDREKRWYEPNINAIMSWDGPYDQVCGSTLLKGGLCRIGKA